MGWGLGLQVQSAALAGGGLQVDFVGVAHGLSFGNGTSGLRKRNHRQGISQRRHQGSR